MTSPDVAALNGSSWSASDGWAPHGPSLAMWPSLSPGTTVRVVKRDVHGTDRAEYPGVIVPTSVPWPWLEIEAHWTGPPVDVAGLVFTTGDRLREFFSPLHPFNIFVVEAPDGDVRGWYGNVTFPAFLTIDGPEPTIVWQDLILDAVAIPDHPVQLLDDDQLDALPSMRNLASFHRALRLARETMIRHTGTVPGRH